MYDTMFVHIIYNGTSNSNLHKKLNLFYNFMSMFL
jgi:hypothetical protein